jgi:hypothetical protein
MNGITRHAVNTPPSSCQVGSVRIGDESEQLAPGSELNGINLDIDNRP